MTNDKEEIYWISKPYKTGNLGFVGYLIVAISFFVVMIAPDSFSLDSNSRSIIIILKSLTWFLLGIFLVLVDFKKREMGLALENEIRQSQ